jgi:D-alanine-D-alanine ligase
MIFRESGLPTPDFAVLDGPDFAAPDLDYPLIVKPRHEAGSFGVAVVHNEKELRDASSAVFDSFQQGVLVEKYIDGREINVGLLGNNPPDVFPPVELIFGKGGPKVFTLEDKKGLSGRKIRHRCPPDLDYATISKAQELARKAFSALGCADWARVDMRIDKNGEFHILELNSLPSLGLRGSYVTGAKQAGLDFASLINRLVEVADARYFGTPRS